MYFFSAETERFASDAAASSPSGSFSKSTSEHGMSRASVVAYVTTHWTDKLHVSYEMITYTAN